MNNLFSIYEILYSQHIFDYSYENIEGRVKICCAYDVTPEEATLWQNGALHYCF